MMQRIGALALAALIGAFAGSCLVWSVGDDATAENGKSANAEEERTQTATQGVLSLINDAWKAEDGAPLMREALAEKYVALMPQPNDPAKFRVVGREKLVELFAKAQQASRAQKHEHRAMVMMTAGNVVYEIGVSEHVSANGAYRQSDVFNIFVEDESGWKLLFSADARDMRDVIRLLDKQSEKTDG